MGVLTNGPSFIMQPAKPTSPSSFAGREIPSAGHMADRSPHGVGVIALDASAGETAEAVAEFAAKKNLSMPIALDAHAATADLFGIRTMPQQLSLSTQNVCFVIAVDSVMISIPMQRIPLLLCLPAVTLS